MTDKEVVVTALKILTVIPAAVTDPDPGLLATGQGELRRFINELALQSFTLYGWARLVFPLSSGISEYTVGDGADFNMARPPLGIKLWSIIPDRNAADPMELPRRRPDTIDRWRRIPIKTATSSYPSRLYYDATIDPSGFTTVAVYPVPDNGNADIVLYAEAGLVEMDPSVDYIVPTAYESLLVNNLALKLKKFFPAAPLDRQVVIDARDALLLVKRANWQPETVLSDAPWGTGGHYDIYQDDYVVPE